jgi:SAM-dependent MidA family methyltransferase
MTEPASMQPLPDRRAFLGGAFAAAGVALVTPIARAVGSMGPVAASDTMAKVRVHGTVVGRYSAFMLSDDTATMSIDTLQTKPAIVLANEFFDALPIRQYQKEAQGWHERLVGLDDDHTLILGLSAEPAAHLAALKGEEGSVYEEARIAATIMRSLARHLRSYGGVMLTVDYGHSQSGMGDTWQALSQHHFIDPLLRAGEADQTSHVDFQKLSESAQAGGAVPSSIITQRDLLLRLGLEPRMQQLTRGNPDRSYDITKACLRLIDHTSPQAMGQLFKALAISHPNFGPIPAFDAPSS